jgi:hypothetical protein
LFFFVGLFNNGIFFHAGGLFPPRDRIKCPRRHCTGGGPPPGIHFWRSLYQSPEKPTAIQSQGYPAIQNHLRLALPVHHPAGVPACSAR